MEDRDVHEEQYMALNDILDLIFQCTAWKNGCWYCYKDMEMVMIRCNTIAYKSNDYDSLNLVKSINQLSHRKKGELCQKLEENFGKCNNVKYREGYTTKIVKYYQYNVARVENFSERSKRGACIVYKPAVDCPFPMTSTFLTLGAKKDGAVKFHEKITTRRTAYTTNILCQPISVSDGKISLCNKDELKSDWCYSAADCSGYQVVDDDRFTLDRNYGPCVACLDIKEKRTQLSRNNRKVTTFNNDIKSNDMIQTLRNIKNDLVSNKAITKHDTFLIGCMKSFLLKCQLAIDLIGSSMTLIGNAKEGEGEEDEEEDGDSSTCCTSTNGEEVNDDVDINVNFIDDKSDDGSIEMDVVDDESFNRTVIESNSVFSAMEQWSRILDTADDSKLLEDTATLGFCNNPNQFLRSL